MPLNERHTVYYSKAILKCQCICSQNRKASTHYMAGPEQDTGQEVGVNNRQRVKLLK